jgi:hypothetical protein
MWKRWLAVWTAVLLGGAARADYVTLESPGMPGLSPTGISGNNIVGTYFNPNSGFTGFLYNGNTYSTFNVPGAAMTTPTGISGNNIVGSYSDASFNSHGFLYNGSTFTTIDGPNGPVSFPGGPTIGANIVGVSSDNVVGNYNDTSGNMHSFVYNAATGTYSEIKVPGSGFTDVLGISGKNVLGTYSGTSGFRYFLYNGSTYSDLNVPGGINAQLTGISGDTVIDQYFDSSTGQHDILYDFKTNTTTPINIPGASSIIPTGIDGNRVVGTYLDFATPLSQAFLYTAGGQAEIASAPEPSSLTLLTLGVLGLAGFRGRRR